MYCSNHLSISSIIITEGSSFDKPQCDLFFDSFFDLSFKPLSNPLFIISLNKLISESINSTLLRSTRYTCETILFETKYSEYTDLPNPGIELSRIHNGRE